MGKVHIFTITCYFMLFDNSHSNRCEVISHYDFLSFIFLIMTLSIFSCTSWSPVWLLFKKSIHSSAHILTGIFLFVLFVFFAVELNELFIYFGYYSLIRYICTYIFAHIWKVVCSFCWWLPLRGRSVLIWYCPTCLFSWLLLLLVSD